MSDEDRLTDPTEKETATTSGYTLFFAGATGHFDNADKYVADLLQLGGKYSTGPDYSSLDKNAITVKDKDGNYIFDERGAVAVMTVENGKGQDAFDKITLGAIGAFYWSAADSLFPNNHDPLGTAKNDTADYVFFDIGNFVGQQLIPNFVDESIGKDAGQIKSLALEGDLSTFNWLHFDVMAIGTDINKKSALNSNLFNNPGSHDVTWKNGGGNPGGLCEVGDTRPECNPTVPEPNQLALLGIGLFAMGAMRTIKGRKLA